MNPFDRDSIFFFIGMLVGIFMATAFYVVILLI